MGNCLMLDEGVALAAYDLFQKRYNIPQNVALFDVGCMSMDMLSYVRDYDFLLTVDAVDATGKPPGTVVRFHPDAVARTTTPKSSLHEMKLVDLFDAALLLGYQAEGCCVGMQIENMMPDRCMIGLTPAVQKALPLLVETIAAELVKRGFALTKIER